MEEGGEGEDIKGNERAKASTLLAMATGEDETRSLRRAEQIVEGGHRQTQTEADSHIISGHSFQFSL